MYSPLFKLYINSDIYSLQIRSQGQPVQIYNVFPFQRFGVGLCATGLHKLIGPILNFLVAHFNINMTVYQSLAVLCKFIGIFETAHFHDGLHQRLVLEASDIFSQENCTRQAVVYMLYMRNGITHAVRNSRGTSCRGKCHTLNIRMEGDVLKVLISQVPGQQAILERCKQLKAKFSKHFVHGVIVVVQIGFHTMSQRIHSGAMDALAHGVESYIHNGSNIVNRQIADIGFRMFAQYKDNLLNNTLEAEDFQNMQLVSFIMGMAFMQSSTTIPHGMGYPLSHYKRVNHGLACAIFLGEYLMGFKDQSLVLPIVKACGFSSSREFADYIASITQQNVKIEVTHAEIEKWTDDFMKLDFRIASNPEPLTRDDIRFIYLNSLAPYLAD